MTFEVVESIKVCTDSCSNNWGYPTASSDMK